MPDQSYKTFRVKSIWRGRRCGSSPPHHHHQLLV